MGFAYGFSSVGFHLWIFICGFSSVDFHLSFLRIMRAKYASEAKEALF